MTQEPPAAANPPHAPSPHPQPPLTPAPWAPAPPSGQRVPPGYGPMPVPGGYPPPAGQPFAGYGLQPPPYPYPVPPGYAVPPPPPPLSPAGQPLASFLDRFLAYLVDGAVFSGVAMVLGVPAFIIFFAVVGPDLFRVQPDGTITQPGFFTFFMPFLLLEGVLMLVLLGLYYVYHGELMFRSGRTFGQSGQTLGKKVMKIKIVPLDPAATLDRRFAAKRFLVQFVGGMFVPGLSYLDGLWQLWDKPHQQCLHDKFAQTVVVKVPA